MTNNIFRVMNNNDLTEILQDHAQKLVVAMYSSQECGPCINFKPKFVAYAKVNPDIFFVYIDINNFKDPQHQYLSNVNATPKFIFYFNTHMIGDIVGADEKVFVETIEYLKSRIDERHHEIEQQELLHKQQKMEEENYLKIELLKKLYELTQRGVKLTQSYNMNSSVDKMMWEYNLHMKNLQAAANQAQVQLPLVIPNVPTNQSALSQQSVTSQQDNALTQQIPKSPPNVDMQLQSQTIPIQQQQVAAPIQPVQIPQQIVPHVQQTPQTQSTEQLYTAEQMEQMKKHEKLEKIKELKRLQQLAQMEDFLKLQKLQKLKAMKQQKEKQETESSASSEEHEN
jgi:thiol-disulfide isomerase/thioredoxin